MKITEKITDILGKSKERLQPTVTMFGESKTVQILSCVFVLQLFIAVGLSWNSNSQAQFAPATQLVSIDPSTVDEVTVDDGENTVSLTLSDTQWQLNDEHNTRAATDKVEKLVSEITQLKPGLPVTSTRGAHQQLEVAEDSFQRHITLKAAETIVAELYLGTSPGFRKSHLRQADQDEVFAARLSTFDVPADYDDWLDRKVLAFDSVDGIRLENLDLAFDNDQWSIVIPEGRRETHEVDETGIDSIITQLTTLQVNGFAQPLEAKDSAQAESADDASDSTEVDLLETHTVTIVQNDAPVTLVLSKLGNDVTVERSDVPGLFSLPVATYEALTPENFQQLLVTREPDTSAEDDRPQG